MPVLLTVKGPVTADSYCTVGPEFVLGDWQEDAAAFLSADLTCDGLFPHPNLEDLHQQWWLRQQWHFPENLKISKFVLQEILKDLGRVAERLTPEKLPLILIVPVARDEDLLGLRSYQTNDKTLICAAADLASLVPSGPPSGTDKSAVSQFSELNIQRESTAEVAANKLYCRLREGVTNHAGKAYYGCIYVRQCCTDFQRGALDSALARFSPQSPAVIRENEVFGSFQSNLRIGNLSWRCFGGEGIYNRLRTAALIPSSALNFDWDVQPTRKNDGNRYVCDLCSTEFYCKDDPLRKFSNTYCSIKCVSSHRQAGWPTLAQRN